ncbi:PREDICTED: uncharacterized protein LOC105153648 [Acromyrmex echinatior]|uniref:uncharacterized protein LOC105153648 n=1 Tax=Acromyrmex echinatior TaxID=103372 RepID=UPI00058104A8|nr:PREDICTED: uncharacterized protein LOC105153648 [Acromyrmex echinatior]
MRDFSLESHGEAIGEHSPRISSSNRCANFGTGGFTREIGTLWDPPRWPPTQREENYRNRPLIFHRELFFREQPQSPAFRTYLPTNAEVLTSCERSETAETRDAASILHRRRRRKRRRRRRG